jgi:suppressor of fused
MEEPNTSGWDAITGALEPLYPGVEPKHWAATLPAIVGGPDPLQGISGYWRSRPVPHWHFVTYGFSELYDKESDDPAVSGFGFELTLRVAAAPDSQDPPPWVFNFLQNLARYVFKTGNRFASAHRMNLNGPIALGTDTAIRAIAFTGDPELPPIETPNGALEFLQVVGITLDEEVALQKWATEQGLVVMGPHLPLFVTDLDRRSLLEIAAVKAELDAGARRDGSSNAMIFVGQLAWNCPPDSRGGVTMAMGAGQVALLRELLPYRLAYGRELWLVGQNARIALAPGPAVKKAVNDGTLRITLDASAQGRLVEILKPVVGVYEIAGEPEILIEVRRTEIKDGKGNVVETIG